MTGLTVNGRQGFTSDHTGIHFGFAGLISLVITGRLEKNNY